MADKGEDVTPVGETNSQKQSLSEKTAVEDKSSEDPELNDLLDSALEDFDKPELKSGGAGSISKSSGAGSKSEGSNVDGGAAAAGTATGAGIGSNPADFGAMFGAGPDDAVTEELADEMAKQFEEAMKSFMSQDPEMMQQINKLAEAAGNAGESPQAQQEFAQTLTQTLSGLAANAESLQQEMTEEEISQAFGGGGAGGAGPGGDMFPMMHGMMRMLLSKDVLYPSLKEIADKYPKWLEENQEKEEQSALENYRRQHQLISSICVEFEAESVSDTEEVKTQRFEKMMDLMQQMQELGQPPKDIVGEMAPGLEFDESGMPKLPGMKDQCAIM